MSITYNCTLNNYTELGDKLWGKAAKKWSSASDEVKSAIWDSLQKTNKFESFELINDSIWYDYDDLFYSELVFDWFYKNCMLENYNDDVDKWIDHLIAIAEQDDEITIYKCINTIFNYEDEEEDEDTFLIIENILAVCANSLLNDLIEDYDNNNKKVEDNFRLVDHTAYESYESLINTILRDKFEYECNYAMFAATLSFDYSCLILAFHDCESNNESAISHIRILTNDDSSKTKYIIGNDEYDSFNEFKKALFDLCTLFLENH